MQSTGSFNSSVSDWTHSNVTDLGIKLQPGTEIYQIRVEELHPTQLCVGMQQVIGVLVAAMHHDASLQLLQLRHLLSQAGGGLVVLYSRGATSHCCGILLPLLLRAGA